MSCLRQSAKLPSPALPFGPLEREQHRQLDHHGVVDDEVPGAQRVLGEAEPHTLVVVAGIGAAPVPLRTELRRVPQAAQQVLGGAAVVQYPHLVLEGERPVQVVVEVTCRRQRRRLCE